VEVIILLLLPLTSKPSVNGCLSLNHMKTVALSRDMIEEGRSHSVENYDEIKIRPTVRTSTHSLTHDVH